VADFIGSPPMNFLHFKDTLAAGDTRVTLSGQPFDIPRQHQAASGDLVFGVRPENVSLDQSSDYKGEVMAVEYLGTTQIITIDSPNGTIKARLPAAQQLEVGQVVGLAFNPRTITIFDKSTGAALLSDANKGVLDHD